jgi:Cu-Zn family superoxide dismutase
MKSCCDSDKNDKICKRYDGKTFKLPRRFSKKKCLTKKKGFSMRSSCSPYKKCMKGGKIFKKGICVLASNKNEIEGIINITEFKNGLEIEYKITGLTDGLHGFHIHEYGDLSEGCKSGCSHFNPFNETHGGLNTKHRHAGDLGNILSQNNNASGKIFVNKLCLKSNDTLSILGRMIIIHDKEDDLGKGNDTESLKTGNAGERLACGVIGLKK